MLKKKQRKANLWAMGSLKFFVAELSFYRCLICRLSTWRRFPDLAHLQKCEIWRDIYDNNLPHLQAPVIAHLQHTHKILRVRFFRVHSQACFLAQYKHIQDLLPVYLGMNALFFLWHLYYAASSWSFCFVFSPENGRKHLGYSSKNSEI